MSEEATLPAATPRVRIEGSDVLTNSRDVAEWFGKEHRNVVRDIKALEICSDLSASWFRERTQPDAYGRDQITIDMTRDGFTVLVMGWTGARAMEFKIRYIEAFNAQEAGLRVAKDRSLDIADAIADVVQIQRENSEAQRALFALASRSLTDQATLKASVDTVVDRVDGIDRTIGEMWQSIESRLNLPRRNGKKADVPRHCRVVQSRYSGMCPCCGENRIVGTAGEKLPSAELDHIDGRHKNAFALTWLVCKRCNRDFETGRISITVRKDAFATYQHRAATAPGAQMALAL